MRPLVVLSFVFAGAFGLPRVALAQGGLRSLYEPILVAARVELSGDLARVDTSALRVVVERELKKAGFAVIDSARDGCARVTIAGAAMPLASGSQILGNTFSLQLQVHRVVALPGAPTGATFYAQVWQTPVSLRSGPTTPAETEDLIRSTVERQTRDLVDELVRAKAR